MDKTGVVCVMQESPIPGKSHPANVQRMYQRGIYNSQVRDMIADRIGDGRAYIVQVTYEAWDDQAGMGRVPAKRYGVGVRIVLANQADAEIGEWVDESAFDGKISIDKWFVYDEKMRAYKRTV